MEKRELTCITCPMGCSLTAVIDGETITVSGNRCPRGEKYAKAELTHPTRTLTSTVAVKNRAGKYVSVKTNAPISKDKLFDAMKILGQTKVDAPVKSGDVIIKDIFGEADIIATSSID